MQPLVLIVCVGGEGMFMATGELGGSGPLFGNMMDPSADIARPGQICSAVALLRAARNGDASEPAESQMRTWRIIAFP